TRLTSTGGPRVKTTLAVGRGVTSSTGGESAVQLVPSLVSAGSHRYAPCEVVTNCASTITTDPGCACKAAVSETAGPAGSSVGVYVSGPETGTAIVRRVAATRSPSSSCCGCAGSTATAKRSKSADK